LLLRSPGIRVAERRPLERQRVPHLLETALESFGALIVPQASERGERAPDTNAGDEEGQDGDECPRSAAALDRSVLAGEMNLDPSL
jgi:hypothetical protein